MPLLLLRGGLLPANNKHMQACSLPLCHAGAAGAARGLHPKAHGCERCRLQGPAAAAARQVADAFCHACTLPVCAYRTPNCEQSCPRVSCIICMSTERARPGHPAYALCPVHTAPPARQAARNCTGSAMIWRRTPTRLGPRTTLAVRAAGKSARPAEHERQPRHAQHASAAALLVQAGAASRASLAAC